MKHLNLSSERGKITIVFIVTITIGGFFFLINAFTGIINMFIFIIQIFLGLIFGVWYFRVCMSFIHEVRKKSIEKRVGVPKAWAIFGILSSLINVIIWGFFSSLIFNLLKIFFLIPFALALIEIIYVIANGNRRKARDWLLLTYNIFAFFYVFNWTFVDFGFDFPNVLGFFAHTLNGTMMWWQIIFVNTNAFFTPTFLFPPYMLNPRYYFAMPVEKYYLLKENDEIKALSDKPTFFIENEKLLKVDEKNSEEKPVIGERKPYFLERKKLREQELEIQAIKRELAKTKLDEDTKYAEYVGSTDFSFKMRKLVQSFESLLRNFSLGIILILLVILPVVFVGNISMNITPNYLKNHYDHRPEMVLAIKGNVFSTFDRDGNISRSWSNDLDEEIQLIKELHATHLRYDVKSSGLNNTHTQNILSEGLQRVKNEGIKTIICLKSDVIIYSKKQLINNEYREAQFVAQNYQPDYLIIFNELNGRMQSYNMANETIIDWLPEITNTTNAIKLLSPTTKVLTTLLASKDAYGIFQELLTNTTLLIDAVGVIYYPFIFGWQTNKLLQFGEIYRNSSSARDFWVSEIGLQSFNFGEKVQAKSLAKYLSLSSQIDILNVKGFCITSLIDNIEITIDRGVVSHFGLVYYNGRKKIVFNAISYGFGTILGEI